MAGEGWDIRRDLHDGSVQELALLSPSYQAKSIVSDRHAFMALPFEICSNDQNPTFTAALVKLHVMAMAGFPFQKVNLLSEPSRSTRFSLPFLEARARLSV